MDPPAGVGKLRKERARGADPLYSPVDAKRGRFLTHFSGAYVVSRLSVVAIALLAVTACRPAEQAQESDTASTTAAVDPSADILSPAEGDSVSLPVTIRLGATGVTVVPATGQPEPGKGHHHVILDLDAPTDSLPLPKPPQAYHLGNGATEIALDSLAPGPHRVIAVFASGDHIPMKGVRRDTVTFIVR